MAIHWLPFVSALISAFLVCANSASAGHGTVISNFRFARQLEIGSGQAWHNSPGPSPTPAPALMSKPNPNPNPSPNVPTPIFVPPTVLPALPTSSDKHLLQTTIGLVLICFAGALQVFVIAYLFFKRRKMLKYVRPPENGPPHSSQ